METIIKGEAPRQDKGNITMKSLSIIVCVAVIFYCSVEPTYADGGEEPSQEDQTFFTVKLLGEAVESADIDDTGVSSGYREFSTEIKWRLLSFECNYREYDWDRDEASNAPFIADLWDDLTQISPGIQYYKDFSNDWSIWGKFAAVAGFENEISSGSWTYNPQAMILYGPDKSIKLYFGLGALYHPVETDVYPVLGVAYNLERKQGLSYALGFPETMARFRFGEGFAVKAAFQWDIRTYRLDQSNDPVSQGYVKIEALTPGLWLEAEPMENLILSWGLRGYLERSLTLYDHDENELTSHEPDASLSYQFGVNYRF